MTRDLLKKTGYSDKAIDYIINKVNVGKLKNPSIEHSYQGPCGDTMKLYLKIESDLITDASFEATGCAGVFSAGSALTELIKGKELNEAKKITEAAIIAHLEDVPPHKADCVVLAKKTFENAIQQFSETNTGS